MVVPWESHQESKKHFCIGIMCHINMCNLTIATNYKGFILFSDWWQILRQWTWEQYWTSPPKRNPTKSCSTPPAGRSAVGWGCIFGIKTFLRGSEVYLRASLLLTQGLTCPTSLKNKRLRGSEVSWSLLGKLSKQMDFISLLTQGLRRPWARSEPLS